MTWSVINERLAVLDARHKRTTVGSCWLQRTGQDRSRRAAAGGQRSDSDPQHSSSTAPSAAEAAVLQGEARRTDGHRLVHHLHHVINPFWSEDVRDEEVC